MNELIFGIVCLNGQVGLSQATRFDRIVPVCIIIQVPYLALIGEKMSRKLITILTMLVLASLLLTACGASAPTPPQPFSKMALDSKLEDLRKQMEDKEKAAMEGVTVEVKGYSTTEATADEIVTYYKEALKDWTVEDPGEVPEGITFAKWTKGANAFVLMILPMPDGSEGLAIFTETASK